VFWVRRLRSCRGMCLLIFPRSAGQAWTRLCRSPYAEKSRLNVRFHAISRNGAMLRRPVNRAFRGILLRPSLCPSFAHYTETGAGWRREGDGIERWTKGRGSTCVLRPSCGTRRVNNVSCSQKVETNECGHKRPSDQSSRIKDSTRYGRPTLTVG